MRSDYVICDDRVKAHKSTHLKITFFKQSHIGQESGLAINGQWGLTGINNNPYKTITDLVESGD